MLKQSSIRPDEGLSLCDVQCVQNVETLGLGIIPSTSNVEFLTNQILNSILKIMLALELDVL